MFKKTRYIDTLAGLIIICCFSCHSATKEQAQNMSAALLTINDSVSFKGRALGKCISMALRDKDYSRIGPLRQQYQDYIDSCGRAVKHMNDVGGSEQMRRAELAVLGFEKTMVQNDLVMFEKLKPESTPSEISVLFQIGNKDAKKEADFIAKFKEIQQEYAKKNGF